MRQKFRMFLMKVKMEWYGIMFNSYKCKALKHPYYVNKLSKYNDKLVTTAAKFKEEAERKQG